MSGLPPKADISRTEGLNECPLRRRANTLQRGVRALCLCCFFQPVVASLNAHFSVYVRLSALRGFH